MKSRLRMNKPETSGDSAQFGGFNFVPLEDTQNNESFSELRSTEKAQLDLSPCATNKRTTHKEINSLAVSDCVRQLNEGPGCDSLSLAKP